MPYTYIYITFNLYCPSPYKVYDTWKVYSLGINLKIVTPQGYQKAICNLPEVAFFPLPQFNLDTDAFNLSGYSILLYATTLCRYLQKRNAKNT